MMIKGPILDKDIGILKVHGVILFFFFFHTHYDLLRYQHQLPHAVFTAVWVPALCSPFPKHRFNHFLLLLLQLLDLCHLRASFLPF